MTKRIAIFSSHYAPHVGGVENYTQSLAFALARLGCEVVVVTNQLYDESPLYEEPRQNVRIYRLPAHRLMKGRMPLPCANSQYRALCDEIFAQDYDGILVNTRFFVHSFLGIKLAQSKGLCPVVLDHGSAYLTLANPVLDIAIKAYEHATSAVMKLSKPAFYGVSAKSVEWLKTFGISAQGTLPNAIDAKEFCELSSGRNFREELSLQEAFVVGFTGRLIPEKGLDVLLEVAQSLAGRYKDIHFLVAGDGPMKRRLDEASLGNVHAVGRLTRPDIAALLQSCDVFMLPTRSEGFCTSLLECAAVGLPFIVPEVGGAKELAPNDGYSFVLKDRRPQAFEAALLELHGSKQLRNAQSYKLQQRCQKEISWELTAKALLAAFERASR